MIDRLEQHLASLVVQNGIVLGVDAALLLHKVKVTVNYFGPGFTPTFVVEPPTVSACGYELLVSVNVLRPCPMGDNLRSGNVLRYYGNASNGALLRLRRAS